MRQDKKLIQEITKYSFFLFNQKQQIIPDLFSPTFLEEKKLSFEDENNEKYEKNIYTMSGKIENVNVEIVGSSLDQDDSGNITEAVIIISVNNKGSQVIYTNSNDGKYEIYYSPDDIKFIRADIIISSKLLTGIEQLSRTPLHWTKMDNIEKMHKSLLAFLNYVEQLIIKKDLINLIVKKTNFRINRDHIRAVISFLLEDIEEKLLNGDKIIVHNFASIYIKKHKGRAYRNVKTGIKEKSKGYYFLKIILTDRFRIAIKKNIDLERSGLKKIQEKLKK